jgi:HK97 family phage prohead protease
MKTKHLTSTFEMKEVKEDEEFFYFEGYGATFGNVDFGGDVILKGAFSRTLTKMATVPVLYQHNTREPVGIFTELKEDEKGLYVKGKLPKSDSMVRDRIIPQMKVGSISKMSIGYMVTDSEWKGDMRILKELELFEISLVTFPMNDQANITAMKGEEGYKITKDMVENDVKSIREAEEMLRDAGFSQSASKAMISVIRKTADKEDAEAKFLTSLASLVK